MMNILKNMMRRTSIILFVLAFVVWFVLLLMGPDAVDAMRVLIVVIAPICISAVLLMWSKEISK